LAWVVAVDDLAPVELRLGRPAVLGHRRRPDGLDLTWRQIGVLDVLDDPALPFFIEWDVAAELHPSANGETPIGIEGAEICGDRDTIARWLDEPLERANFHFDWIQDEEAGLVAVRFSTPGGIVRID
jgi:hypothetical protein